MAADVITFANLGEKRNQPTADILPVIRELARAGELAQVICQLHKNFEYPNTQAAVPWPLRYALRAYEKVTRRSVSRRLVESLFDRFASQKLQPAKVTFFHGGYFLPRTFMRAQRQGACTVDISRTAHLDMNARLETEEFARLGITGEGIYPGLARICTHCNSFDYVIAISDFVRDTYIAAGFPAERIFLAYPDIDTERFQPSEKKVEVFRVLYSAYTAPIKGLHYLLEAWERLALPDAELILLGGYGGLPAPLKERYDRQIQKDASIRWMGSTEEPERFYQDASVFAFPSLTEGFGRVTLEAMACGIPVITTENARGIVEDGKSGFIVPIRDSQALAEKIRYLYDHQEEALQMGMEARLAVERKKPFGEAIYEIYQEIMRRERVDARHATVGTNV